MAQRVGINGFGRIGRQVLKSIKQYHNEELEIVAINDLFDADTNAHLLKYDSNYGIYPGSVEVDDGDLIVDGDRIKVFAEREPGNLPWGDLGVKIVVEATGVFRDASKDPGPHSHINRAGAQKVIISAPAKNEDLTLVLGVNDSLYDHEVHNVVSNASCTTNCLAPAVKVVNDKFKIIKGLMTTIHSYTTTQHLLDLAHKKDPRRSRAAALNIIPTTTGAARALALVLPELEGKFDGFALRVPTPTVSVVDFVAEVETMVSIEDVNLAFKEAADGPMEGILGYSDIPLVSMDYKGDPRSSIVDGPLTNVMGDNMVKVVAWYDNEWGYSVRTADLAAMMAKSL